MPQRDGEVSIYRCDKPPNDTTPRCAVFRRNDELERQMLEITTSFKARLAEAEGERERAAVVAKKERRVLTKQLRLAKEEKATLARRAVATGGLAEHLNAATLPLPASSASTSLPDPTTRQGDF